MPAAETSSDEKNDTPPHSKAPSNLSFDSSTPLISENEPHLVIIVPGIRDRGGDWSIVRDQLTAAGFSANVVTWNEYFGIPRFLVPGPWFRRKAMRELEERILDAIHAQTIKRTQPKISFIAHSFGSYILCYLLRRRDRFNVHRIIICGSVLPRSFRFAGFATRFNGPVINEVGRRDRWPFVASCVTFGYGTIGTYGYLNAPVEDRFHDDVGHDGFTEPKFCVDWWVPVLKSSGRIISIPTPNCPIKETSLKRSYNRLLQNIKWIILILLILLFLQFLPGWLPCFVQVPLGLRSEPCDLGVHIVRISDMSSIGCSNGKRAYRFANSDTLRFSMPVDRYKLQAHVPSGAKLKVLNAEGKEIAIEESMPLLSTGGWFRKIREVPVSGRIVKLQYQYEGIAESNDNEWGFGFVSSLPIFSLSADASLPAGKLVTGFNKEKSLENRAFSGCTFNTPTQSPSLRCSEPLNNEPNVPQWLYWNWTVFENC